MSDIKIIERRIFLTRRDQFDCVLLRQQKARCVYETCYV